MFVSKRTYKRLLNCTKSKAEGKRPTHNSDLDHPQKLNPEVIHIFETHGQRIELQFKHLRS